jgi:hypothetical protein
VSAHRSYQSDGAGRFFGAQRIEARDDEAALAAACAPSASTACEIWQGQRFVGKITGGEDGEQA